MEFRAPIVATRQNVRAIEYLTKDLDDPDAGETLVQELIAELGNVVDNFPDWHPILTAPQDDHSGHIYSTSQLSIYNELDHTIEFVRGFVTCPYSKQAAEALIAEVGKVAGLSASLAKGPLYSDKAFPVVVEATAVDLEADGTIRSRDALAWFVQEAVKHAREAQVGETWWNMRSNILGTPHGSRSSLFVNQHAGSHMRKILEAMNNSGMFGPIKESSLEMLSQKKRDKIGQTLLRAAVSSWDGKSAEFEFELRGERCKCAIRDTWKDGYELSLRVEIGKFDLFVSGFYYESDDRIESVDPRGKRSLAEKFI